LNNRTCKVKREVKRKQGTSDDFGVTVFRIPPEKLGACGGAVG
jgi:hypothetical protein